MVLLGAVQRPWAWRAAGPFSISSAAGQKLLLANKERGEKDFIDFCFSIREVMLINMDVNL